MKRPGSRSSTPGGAVDPVSGLLKLHGPLVVDLEGGTIAVVSVAVGFDDHPLPGPEEIDRSSATRTLT